ncbi:pectin acetylesterase, family CE13 [Zostera marina]|uniref:Pectin acetylesterase n=1 Tax=Zostera marina TaxID=29655 RepID=A0A0K9PW08_ZOSMR|nr:pectin acetylesterase, family CE13 [Zostera marina]
MAIDWLTKKSKGKDQIIRSVSYGSIALAFVITVFHLLPNDHYLKLNSSFDVDISLVHQKAAVCLDGSPAAYHLHRGFGSGSHSWVVFIEGGGWCHTIESCVRRKESALGSSHYMLKKPVKFNGILNHHQSLNPDFFNWNKVMIRYCDGASLLGHGLSKNENKTGLFFRGQIIWEAIMEELLARGLKDASQAVLTGSSAGGLSTFLHCDNFHSLLPNTKRVKCFADGGYFLDSKDITGAMTIRSFYDDVVHLHGLKSMLPKDCIAKKEASQCFFPQELIKFISTPFLILNSAYDWWQVSHILVPKTSNRSDSWLQCMMNIQSCNPEHIGVLNGFRQTLISAISTDFQDKKGSGFYINSCYQHDQIWSDLTWHSYKTQNKTVSEAVGDWFFDRDEVKVIDCAYPCNPTCKHVNLTSTKYRLDR